MTTERHIIIPMRLRPGMPTPTDRSDSLFPSAGTGRLTRLVVGWFNAVSFLVPVGYEDEAGFHYGERAAGKTTINGNRPLSARRL
jgi:hypothetical protein